MEIIASEFQSGRVVDAQGNGAFILADNDPNSKYSGFGFTAGFNITYDGKFYKEWGRLYFDSNSNGIYEGTHVYTDEASGIIDSTIGFGGEGIDEHYGFWYSEEYTVDRGNDVEIATWNRSIDSWVGDWEGLDGLGRFEYIKEIIFDTSNRDDEFVGSTNDDLIYGKKGNDIFAGRLGNDRLFGESGKDILYGDAGNDFLSGGSSSDILYGGVGEDTLYGGSSADKLYGGDDDDKLYGGSSADKLYGQEGDDYLKGHSGNDSLSGGDGDDYLRGGDDGDYLYGENGDDLLKGEDGDDILTGGLGKDDLYGGSGNDVFKLTEGSGYDRIRDFKKGEDRVDIAEFDINALGSFDSGKNLKVYLDKERSDLLSIIYNQNLNGGSLSEFIF